MAGKQHGVVDISGKFLKIEAQTCPLIRTR